jgi:hypothetical protein
MQAMISTVKCVCVNAKLDQPFAGLGNNYLVGEKHRLVYAITDAELTVIACRGHYD